QSDDSQHHQDIPDQPPIDGGRVPVNRDGPAQHRSDGDQDQRRTDTHTKPPSSRLSYPDRTGCNRGRPGAFLAGSALASRVTSPSAFRTTSTVIPGRGGSVLHDVPAEPPGLELAARGSRALRLSHLVIELNAALDAERQL